MGCLIKSSGVPIQALDAGSSAALPDGLRAELEELEDTGGVRHLQEISAQVKVSNRNMFCGCLNCRERCQIWAGSESGGMQAAYGSRERPGAGQVSKGKEVLAVWQRIVLVLATGATCMRRQQDVSVAYQGELTTAALCGQTRCLLCRGWLDAYEHVEENAWQGCTARWCWF